MERRTRWAWWQGIGFVCSGLWLTGCGTSHPERAQGEVRLSLTGNSESHRYRLRDADFAISGPVELLLSSESDPNADELSADLPVGDYEVALQDGWFLEREIDAGFETVMAELISDNPVAFDIVDDEKTFVSFRFRAGEVVNLGEGRLGIGIEIEDEPELLEVAAALDEETLLQPCFFDTSARVCSSKPASGACPSTGDPVLAGTLATDKTVVLGGEPGTFYDIRLRVVGLTEGKTFSGGSDQSSDAELPADGLYVGGRPINAVNAYSTYVIRTSSPAQDYFLNSISVANDTRIRHSTFPLDYEATLRAEGGSSVRLVVADPNCSAIKNCADPDDGTVCTPQISGNLPGALGDSFDQPYDGQFLALDVLDVSVAN